MARSQNGYSANDPSIIKNYNVAGEILPLRNDDCGEILADLALWIHKNVESISAGHQRDDWGYASRPIRGSSTLSNHASGTAMDFNATQHPLGVRGTWTAAEKTKINRALRTRYSGVIGWGENWTSRVDGMHFEIDEDYAAVQAALRKIRSGGRNRPRAINAANVIQAFKTGQQVGGVKVVQRELRRRGYMPADSFIDGIPGPNTKAGMRRFQRSRRVFKRRDGVPTKWQLRVLGGMPVRLRFRVR